MHPVALVHRCHSEIDRLTKGFSETPNRGDFTNLTSVAELLLAFPPSHYLEDFRPKLVSSSLNWLRSGMLTDIAVAGPEFLHGIAMILALASEDASFCADDVRELVDLYEGRIIGANELPELTSLVVLTLLAKVGVAPKSDVHLPIIIEHMQNVERRSLRTESFEHDYVSLFGCAHLYQITGLTLPLSQMQLPKVLLVHALRESGEINRIAILGALCRHVFGVPNGYLEPVHAKLSVIAGQTEVLLPPPDEASFGGEPIDRSALGLRLRGSLACIAFLRDYE
jgi:hypothetical protein